MSNRKDEKPTVLRIRRRMPPPTGIHRSRRYLKKGRRLRYDWRQELEKEYRGNNLLKGRHFCEEMDGGLVSIFSSIDPK